jgi:hypothetical protein
LLIGALVSTTAFAISSVAVLGNLARVTLLDEAEEEETEDFLEKLLLPNLLPIQEFCTLILIS